MDFNLNTGIGAIANLIDDGINKIWPNKSDEEKAKYAELMAELQGQIKLAQAQIETNTAEAQNPNVFVSGGRPFILWVCGAAFAWSYVLQPFCVFALVASHSTFDPKLLPHLDLSSMLPILGGLLGLGGYRTFEKVKGVNQRHG